MKLYSFWRSTTSYRVRAGLNLKGLTYETVPIDLVAGDQYAADYAAVNAGHTVPTLILDDGTVLTQSMVILEFIDAIWPDPQLFPRNPKRRAQTMAVAHTITMDIHPVNNLRVVGQLKSRFGATTVQTTDWMRHWMTEGFTAVEAMLPTGEKFSFGDAPNVADLCITSQVYNARRWGVDLKNYPKIKRIEQQCLNVSAIADAHPDNQPDAKV